MPQSKSDHVAVWQSQLKEKHVRSHLSATCITSKLIMVVPPATAAWVPVRKSSAVTVPDVDMSMMQRGDRKGRTHELQLHVRVRVDAAWE